MQNSNDKSLNLRNGGLTDLVAAAAVIASGTTAYADAIRFDNTANSFDWFYNTLDLTKASDQQVFGQPDGSSIYMNYFSDFYPSFSYYHTYATGGGAEVFSAGFADRYAKPHDAGTLIGPGLADGSWNAGCTFEFEFSACDVQYICNSYKYCNEYGYCYTYYECYYDYNCSSGNRGILPEGVDTYLGVQMDIESQTHYGWIKVRRNSAFLEVLAWGYESTPDTPIAAGAFPPAECPGDANGDEQVDINDLNAVLGNFGTAGPAGDVNGDGAVDIDDLNLTLGNFGTDCT